MGTVHRAANTVILDNSIFARRFEIFIDSKDTSKYVHSKPFLSFCKLMHALLVCYIKYGCEGAQSYTDGNIYLPTKHHPTLRLKSNPHGFMTQISIFLLIPKHTDNVTNQ